MLQFESGEIIVRLKNDDIVIERATSKVQKNHRVPIKLVFLIVIGYICLGGLLFSAWESDGKSELDHNEFFKWVSFAFETRKFEH